MGAKEQKAHQVGEKQNPFFTTHPNASAER
jgi:hypothetical protein